jgi:hypothetical protein
MAAEEGGTKDTIAKEVQLQIGLSQFSSVSFLLL